MASEITYAEVKFKNASPAAVVEGKEWVGYSGEETWREGAEEQGMQTLPFCDSGSYLVFINW